jgi:hypothetical protein
MTLQSHNVCMDDSVIIKNLAQRLANTIEMYEALNAKYKEAQMKIETLERRK